MTISDKTKQIWPKIKNTNILLSARVCLQKDSPTSNKQFLSRWYHCFLGKIELISAFLVIEAFNFPKASSFHVNGGQKKF